MPQRGQEMLSTFTSSLHLGHFRRTIATTSLAREPKEKAKSFAPGILIADRFSHVLFILGPRGLIPGHVHCDRCDPRLHPRRARPDRRRDLSQPVSLFADAQSTLRVRGVLQAR